MSPVLRRAGGQAGMILINRRTRYAKATRFNGAWIVTCSTGALPFVDENGRPTARAIVQTRHEAITMMRRCLP